MYVCLQYLYVLCVYQPVWWLYLYVLIHMYIHCRKMAKSEMCICVYMLTMLVVWHESVSIVCISACIFMYWFKCTSIALAEKWLSVKFVICVCMLAVWHVSICSVYISACIYTWVFNWYILWRRIEAIKQIVANLCQSLEYICHSVPASIPNKLIDRK